MRKILTIICSVALLIVSALSMSACSLSEIFDKAIDLATLEEEINSIGQQLDKAISDRLLLEDKLEAIEAILDENGYEVVSEETEDGIVWYIVEKTDDEVTSDEADSEDAIDDQSNDISNEEIIGGEDNQ